MKTTKAVFLAVLVLGVGAKAQAGIFTFDGPAAFNVDTNPATVVALPVGVVGTVADIDIHVEIITGHSEDFDVALEHLGTTVQLYVGSHFPPHSSFFNVWFDDESAGPVIPIGGDNNDFVGDFKPRGLLSAFDGLPLAGTWNLIILDDYIPNEGDDLVAWSITARVPEPGTLTLLGLGLVALAARRRRTA